MTASHQPLQISTGRAELRRLILELVPDNYFVSASAVVETLSLSAKLVWPEIVMMAMEGVVVTENAHQRGPHRGPAMIRRGS